MRQRSTITLLLSEVKLTMKPPMFWTSVIIKGVRQSKRLSEADLAELLGVDRHRVRVMEAGGHIPRELSSKLNQVLDLDVWDGQRLISLRNRLGYTQEQIADIVSVKRSTYNEWESNRSFIPRYAYDILTRLDKSQGINWSGKELKKLRKRAGWTLAQAAAHVQRDASVWSRWERGCARPPDKAALLEKLEEVLPKEWIEPLRE